MLIKKLNNITEFVAGDKTLLREVLHPKNDPVQLNYSLAYCRVEAGGASIPHILQNRSESYFILEGKGLIHVGNEEALVGPGDTVLVPEGISQFIENKGKEELKFIVVVSPPWTEEDEQILT